MIPATLKESLGRYVSDRIPTGGFLHAVLCNDLYRAVRKADEYNRPALLEIVQYVDGELPVTCYGSPKKVRAWLERKEDEDS